MPRSFALGCVLALAFCAMPSKLVAEPSSNRMTALVKSLERVRPAVANIHSQKIVPTRDPLYPHLGPVNNRMSGMGTGVIVDERGYLITNYHVIEDVTSIRVTLLDGSTYTAEIVARDRETDLALLKIRPFRPLPVMPMGTSGDLLYGETVVAIGNAYGYGNTITRGIISCLHRNLDLPDSLSYRDLIQTDASINPGNSGGPLINADGEMIGLNVAIRAGAQGIGFAIPVDTVHQVVARLMDEQLESQTWHGMACRTLPGSDGEPGRVLVARVDANSPAQAAGIRPGDRLLAIAGVRVSNTLDLERVLLERQPATELPVRVARDGREQSATLLLAQTRVPRIDETIWQQLGVRLDETPVEQPVRQVSTLLRGGLAVLAVRPGSPADRAGLEAGDVLCGLHHWETLSVDNVAYVLHEGAREVPSPLVCYFIRQDRVRSTYVQIARAD